MLDAHVKHAILPSTHTLLMRNGSKKRGASNMNKRLENHSWKPSSLVSLMIFIASSWMLLSCSTPEPKVLPKETPRIRVAMRRDLDRLNPYVAMSLEADLVFKRLFPSLFTELEPKSLLEPELQPNLVSMYTWSENGTKLHLELKEGLEWSDGTPLTTSDLDFTFSIQKDEELNWIGMQGKARIESWNVINEREIDLIFQEACHTNLLDLNEGLILPRHYYQQWPVNLWREREWEIPAVVFGPYRIANHVRGEKLVLKALNPTSPELGFRIIRDKEMHYQLLFNGECDYSWTLPMQRLKDIQDHLKPQFVFENSFAFIAWNPIQPEAIREQEITTLDQLNQLKDQAPHPIFADARVRRALTMAMDLEGMAASLLPSASTTLASPWSIFDASLVQPDIGDRIELARSLLDEAGWTLKNGMRQRNDVPFKFQVLVNTGNLLREQVLLKIAADLAKIGVAMEIRALEPSLYIQACFSRDFDAVFNLVRTGTHPDMKDLFHSSAALNMGYNFASWTQVDAVLEDLACQVDVQDLYQGCRSAHDAFLQDQPITLLYRGTRLAAFSTNGISGRPTLLDPLMDIQDWTAP